MLIRLFQHNSICWDGVSVERPGKVFAAPYLLICGRLAPGSETEQGLERGHGHYIFFQETEERCTFEIRDDSHSSAPGYAATFLHSHQDQRGFPSLQLPTSPQSSLSPPNPGLVHFHFAAQRASDFRWFFWRGRSRVSCDGN